MKIRAAIVQQAGEPWDVTDVELDPPKDDEVLVEIAASGLCHSDEHYRAGDTTPRLPLIGGHEGAGRVLETGRAVTSVEQGDHIILATIPCCGKCRWCLTGKAYLCDKGAYAQLGKSYDGTYRQHLNGADLGKYVQLGSHATHAVVNQMQIFKIDKWVPLEAAALIGCGVTTGWGASVNVAQVEVGENVVVVGVGGVGVSAVQGARNCGAGTIVAVDPFQFRRDAATSTFGATHSAASVADALELVADLTYGVMADKVIICVGLLHGKDLHEMTRLVSKAGRVVVTSVAPAAETTVELGLFEFAMSGKELVGHVFGRGVGVRDYNRLLGLYRSGELLLDEMITKRYSLSRINEGYGDMLEGRTIRGLISFA